LDDFLNRVVAVTEGLLARWRPLRSASRMAKSNPLFDLLQLLVWASLILLLCGFLVVGYSQPSGSQLRFYWRFGGALETPRGSQAYWADKPVVLVGRAGDRVRIRLGQAQVLQAGAETWVPVGPALFTGAVAERYYAGQKGAARAMAAKSFGFSPLAQDSADQMAVGASGLIDPAEWERIAGEVMLQYQPDDTALLSSVQARQTGIWVPEGWVCILSGGDTKLVEAQSLQRIWGE